MKGITIEICTKYGGLKDGIIVMPNITNVKDDNETDTDFFGLARDSIHIGDFYSAASFCFGGNVVATRNLLELYDNNEKKTEYAKLLASLSDFEDDFDRKISDINSISELETYMVVSERISDARQILGRQNPNNISGRQLAYAVERLDTAKAWSKFFDIESKEFLMDEESLEIVCAKKLGEAEERINYMQLYVIRSRDRKDLSLAYDYFYDKNYPMCIFMASKAKANANTVLSALFVRDDNIEELLDAKLESARRAIIDQETNNIFPILGYSYYEYAKTLKGSDNFSSLVYAEYALELSNLDMYFPKEEENFSLHKYTPQHSFVWAIILGFFLGIIFVVIVIYTYGIVISLKKKKSKKKKRKRKR
jgi:predicted S18 family serine protease